MGIKRCVSLYYEGVGVDICPDSEKAIKCLEENSWRTCPDNIKRKFKEDFDNIQLSKQMHCGEQKKQRTSKCTDKGRKNCTAQFYDLSLLDVADLDVFCSKTNEALKCLKEERWQLCSKNKKAKWKSKLELLKATREQHCVGQKNNVSDDCINSIWRCEIPSRPKDDDDGCNVYSKEIKCLEDTNLQDCTDANRIIIEKRLNDYQKIKCNSTDVHWNYLMTLVTIMVPMLRHFL